MSRESVKSARKAIKQSIECIDMRENILTMNKLTRAIQNSMEHHRIEQKDAERMAAHMLNFFGYSDRIIDNILQPNDRDVFYIMEDTGILTTEREETTLYDGREWRINYWLLKTQKIQELLNSKPKKETKDGDKDASLYEELPDEIWER